MMFVFRIISNNIYIFIRNKILSHKKEEEIIDKINIKYGMFLNDISFFK